MSLRYKVGDRVVLDNADALRKVHIPEDYRHCIGTIIDIDYSDEKEPYKAAFEDDEIWWFNDNCINHEATARLNNKTNDSLSELKASIKQVKQMLGGETMNANEILEKWKNKRICEVETEYKNKKDQLTKEDEIAKLIEKHIAQMNKTIKEKYDGVEKAVQVAVIRTPETDEKINLAEEEMSNKKLNIKKKIEEIKAVLEVAENQDKVFEILNKQGIIDKNYNIL